jgi:hypothetical protein
LPAEEDRISRVRNLLDYNFLAVPQKLRVLSRNSIVPGSRPAGLAAHHHCFAHGQRATPALMRIGPLSNEVSHSNGMMNTD